MRQMDEGTSLLAGENDGRASADRRASFALPGLVLAGGALVAATLSLFILLGLTPIKPVANVVIASAAINATSRRIFSAEIAEMRAPELCAGGSHASLLIAAGA